MSWAYVQLDGSFHCLRLSLVRNDAQDFATAEYLSDGHRDRLSRNLGNAFEPTLTDLLLATRVIKVNDQVRIVDSEVRRRIVKSQVPVFPDTDKRNVNRLLRDDLTKAATFITHVISLAIDKMKSARMNAADDALF